LQDVIPALEAAGVDMFEASICIADTFSKMGERTQAMLGFEHRQVAKLTSYASVPVGFAGFVASLAEAERLITDRVADMIGMGRALLADNELILKTIEGRQAEINLCLWDGKCFKDKYNPRYQRVYCCVNPKYLRPV
jgi:2,4-dienoyl-CoA reductase-like NADH-dependent reductase (Old Yellow Enzyme family)